jgi:acyl carrier protein
VSNIEPAVREALSSTLKRPPADAPKLDLGLNLKFDYGLSSLDLIMMMSAVCNQTGVPLTAFDEDEIADLQTPGDIVQLLQSKTLN